MAMHENGWRLSDGCQSTEVVVQIVEVKRGYSWYSVCLLYFRGGECIQQMVLLQCLQDAAAASGAARSLF